ncbi:hypothetical protein WAI453_004697 [Rhynchosporium graminicola]
MESIKSMATRRRTVTIGKSRALEDETEEAEVRQESFPIYELSWAKKLKPFLVQRFPQLKDKYQGSDVMED